MQNSRQFSAPYLTPANDNELQLYDRHSPAILLAVFVVVVMNFSALFFAVYLFAKLLSLADK